MTYIVTGGAGFIGSNFIFYMLAQHPDCRIICLDKLTYAGNLSTLAPVMDDPRFRFVKGISATGRLFSACLRRNSRTWWSTLPPRVTWIAPSRIPACS